MRSKRSRGNSTSTVAIAVSAPALMCAVLGVSGKAAADTYALVGTGNGAVEGLDVQTGDYNTLFNLGTPVEGLAYNSDQSIVFGLTGGYYADTSLVSINMATRTVTPIGSTGTTLTTLTSLSDGSLYGVDEQQNLCSVNASTGVATVIGSSGLTFRGNSLASDGTNLYYTNVDASGDSILYTLDLTSGVATEVGDTGVNDIFGSFFANSTDTLYGFEGNGNIDQIDLNTGAASFMGTSSSPDIFGGIETSTLVPEPSTTFVAVSALTLFYAAPRTGRGTSGRKSKLKSALCGASRKSGAPTRRRHAFLNSDWLPA